MAILDLIEHPNEASTEIVHRVPQNDSGEFALGSQLVVRESQKAIFVRDGKALDVLGPGRHTLSTQNIPLLTGLLGLPFGGKSPFRAEVYFVTTRELTDLKWGTPQPLAFRDNDFGMVRLRAIGAYSIRVADPQLFVTQVVGTRPSLTTSDLDDFLRGIIVNEISDLLGSVHTSLLDIQGMSKELADSARAALSDDFDRLGLQLSTFQVIAITPPDEVAKRIDERSGIGALGDMRTYTQFQTAQAIRRCRQQPGQWWRYDRHRRGPWRRRRHRPGDGRRPARRLRAAATWPAAGWSRCPRYNLLPQLPGQLCPRHRSSARTAAITSHPRRSSAPSAAPKTYRPPNFAPTAAIHLLPRRPKVPHRKAPRTNTPDPTFRWIASECRI